MSPGEAHFLRLLHPILWLVWVAYWIIAARGIKPAKRREETTARLIYNVPLILAMMLLITPRHIPALQHQLFVQRQVVYWIGTVLLVAVLAFCARTKRLVPFVL